MVELDAFSPQQNVQATVAEPPPLASKDAQSLSQGRVLAVPGDIVNAG